MEKHYSSSHKILLVGEGDFSFSASLAAALGSSSNMTATSLDSAMVLEKQYENAVYHIQELKRSGCKVMHGVDATTMSSHPHLKGSTFDRIVFNFPYASVSEYDSRKSQLCAHQSLVRDFLGNAKKMIGQNAEIHITHRVDGRNSAWRIKFLASQQGLELVDMVNFFAADYPGYNVKWRIGCVNFDKFRSKTYKFRLPSPPSNIHSLPAHQEPVFPITVPNQTEIGFNPFPNELFFPMMSPFGDSFYPASQNQNGFYPSSMYLGNNQSKQQEKWIKHYSSGHKILLVGEGDFSFSACLAVAFGSAANMTATSLDSEEFLTTNYCKAFLHLRELKRRGCEVMHGIDATSMIHNPCLMGSKFDRIIFNFPFAGFFKEVPRPSQLSFHQALVWLFLANAKQMLRENGEIHITHKTNGFHREWGIVLIGIQEGLELVAAVDFDMADYPGYSNKYGFGGDNHFDCSPSQTYMFRLPRTAATYSIPMPWLY